VRHLHNRPGDLYLTAVTPVIEGTPDPRTMWDAVLGFVAELPGFAEQVTTVTYQVEYVDEGTNQLVRASIPEHVLERLQITDANSDRWVLGERQSLVTPGALGGRIGSPSTHVASHAQHRMIRRGQPKTSAQMTRSSAHPYRSDRRGDRSGQGSSRDGQ
jgi:hypothetical protein